MEILEWLGKDWVRLVAAVLALGILVGGCCYTIKIEYEYKLKSSQQFFNR